MSCFLGGGRFSGHRTPPGVHCFTAPNSTFKPQQQPHGPAVGSIFKCRFWQQRTKASRCWKHSGPQHVAQRGRTNREQLRHCWPNGGDEMAAQPPAITATAASFLLTGSGSKRATKMTTLYSPKILLNVVNDGGNLWCPFPPCCRP